MNWRAYLLPGLVFQSVIIGGGYATGRELVEFFMPAGPLGGILGLLVAGVVFAIVMGIAYEFARITATHDYRSFCRALLGPAWFVFEIVFLVGVVLILAVVGSAAGELADSVLGWPAWSGTLAMIALVVLLTFRGSALIARVLALWSLLLYAAYLLLFVQTFRRFDDTIAATLAGGGVEGAWPLAGVRYASYNIILPAVMFCMTLIHTRRQAVGAGLMTGVIAILPALAFFVAMLAYYPAIAEQPVPVLFMLAQLDAPGLAALFHVVIFGTFVETGTGLLHAINERIDVHAHERGHTLPRWARPAIAGALLLAAVYGATRIGIVDLIARGYGLLSWAYIAVLVIPLLTIGVLRILRTEHPPSPC